MSRVSLACIHYAINKAKQYYFSNTYSAENIAYGYHSADTVFEAWRLSPGHNVNMLSPNYRAIGIGLAYSATGVPYWTTNFGGV